MTALLLLNDLPSRTPTRFPEGRRPVGAWPSSLARSDSAAPPHLVSLSPADLSSRTPTPHPPESAP